MSAGEGTKVANFAKGSSKYQTPPLLLDTCITIPSRGASSTGETKIRLEIKDLLSIHSMVERFCNTSRDTFKTRAGKNAVLHSTYKHRSPIAKLQSSHCHSYTVIGKYSLYIHVTIIYIQEYIRFLPVTIDITIYD